MPSIRAEEMPRRLVDIERHVFQFLLPLTARTSGRIFYRRQNILAPEAGCARAGFDVFHLKEGFYVCFCYLVTIFVLPTVTERNLALRYIGDTLVTRERRRQRESLGVQECFAIADP